MPSTPPLSSLLKQLAESRPPSPVDIKKGRMSPAAKTALDIAEHVRHQSEMDIYDSVANPDSNAMDDLHALASLLDPKFAKKLSRFKDPAGVESFLHQAASACKEFFTHHKKWQQNFSKLSIVEIFHNKVDYNKRELFDLKENADKAVDRFFAKMEDEIRLDQIDACIDEAVKRPALRERVARGLICCWDAWGSRGVDRSVMVQHPGFRKALGWANKAADWQACVPQEPNDLVDIMTILLRKPITAKDRYSYASSKAPNMAFYELKSDNQKRVFVGYEDGAHYILSFAQGAHIKAGKGQKYGSAYDKVIDQGLDALLRL